MLPSIDERRATVKRTPILLLCIVGFVLPVNDVVFACSQLTFHDFCLYLLLDVYHFAQSEPRIPYLVFMRYINVSALVSVKTE